MMGESAAHSSMSTSVSNEQSPSAGHQAGAGGFYFQSLTQLDGTSPSRSSASASPSTPCTPPTPSTPSGTWHPQLQTCKPIRVINVYEYGKPASYPGPDVFYRSTDTPGNNPGLSVNDKNFKIPLIHRPSPCNCVDCWDARARGETGRIVGGPDARLLTDNKFTNAYRLVQPVVTEYRVVRNKGSSNSTATATDELSDERPSPAPPMGGTVTITGLVDVLTVARSMAELQEMDPDMAAYVTEFAADSVVYQINETGKMKQDEQERVCPKRARDTRALSPLHRRQLKCPPPWLDSRKPHAAAIDGSHARSHSALRTSSRPSRDTRALSPLRPQFEASNEVVPMYSQVHAEIDSGASMTMTPHASLISEGQQCNMSIKLANGSVLTSNVKKGFLDATCNGKLLPKIEALHVPDLAATLISSPQLL